MGINMNSKYKIIVIAIVFMIMLVLTACNKDKGKEDPAINDNKINEKEDLEEEEVWEFDDTVRLTMEDLKKSYPDKKILLWVYDDMMSISPDVNKAINSTLDDKGYEFIILFEEIEISAVEESIDKMIEEGNPPDIICGGLGDAGTLQGTYRSVKKGWLLELDSYLESEEGRALKDVYPKKMWKSFDVNGHIYGINGFLPYNTDLVYFVNQELADKYNISLEEIANLQPSELGDILDIVYQGEKSKDFITYIYEEYYLACYSSLYDYFNRGCDAMVIDNRVKNPEAVNIYKQEDQVSYFSSLAKYRENGYLTTNQEQGEGAVNVNSFFIYQGRDDIFGDKGEEVIKFIKEDFSKVNDVAIVTYAPDYVSKQGNGITGVCKHSDKKDLAFQALSVVYSQKDLSDLLLYGVEDVDYELNDGKVDLDGTPSFRSLYFGNPIISTSTLNEPTNKKEYVFDKISKMEVCDTVGTYIELGDLTEEIDKINSITNEYAGLFDGLYPDVEKTINELNARLEEAGFHSLLDKINHRYHSASE